MHEKTNLLDWENEGKHNRVHLRVYGSIFRIAEHSGWSLANRLLDYGSELSIRRVDVSPYELVILIVQKN